MNLRMILVGMLMLLSTLSCGKAEESDLILTPIGTTSYLIDAASQSCKNIVETSKKPDAEAKNDVAAPSFGYQGIKLGWKNTAATAYITVITFEFNSPTFNYKCTVSGDETMALFYDFEAASNKDWNGTLPPASSVSAPSEKTSASYCRVKCGGVTVSNANNAFAAPGTMTVKGFQRAANGDEKPIKASAPVTLYYQ